MRPKFGWSFFYKDHKMFILALWMLSLLGLFAILLGFSTVSNNSPQVTLKPYELFVDTSLITTSTISSTSTTSTTSTTSVPVTAPVVPTVENPPITEPPSTAPLQDYSSTVEQDFWWWLANCESRNGQLSDNQFQFMGGTAEKVGYYYGAPYEEQKRMAQWWAAQIHPGEGTTAGWPECWWIAQSKT